MDLMGISQNQILPSQLAEKSSSPISSSKESSAPFQKKLDQFSKSNDSISKASQPSGFEKKQSSSEIIEKKQFSGNEAPYRKPINSIPKAPQRMVDSQKTLNQNLVDEEIESSVRPRTIDLQKNPKVETVDSLTRRAAIQTFMQKMKDQLGVDTNAIVNAFTQLTMDELAAPPEANVDKIISFLNLDESGQQIAKKLFDDMLAQSSANSIADYLKSTDREISLSVLSKNQQREQNVQKSIDTMNNSFFPKKEVQQNPQSLSETSEKYSDQDSDVKVNGKSDRNYGAGFFTGLAGAAGAAAMASSQIAGQSSQAPQATTTASPQFSQTSDGGVGQSYIHQGINQNSLGLQSQSPMNPQLVDANINAGMPLDGSWQQVTPTSMPYQEIPTSQLQQVTQASKSQMGKSAYGLNKTSMSAPASGELEFLGANEAAEGEESSFVNALAKKDSKDDMSTDSGSDSKMDQSDLSALSDGTDADAVDMSDSEFSVKADAGAHAHKAHAENQVKGAEFSVGAHPTENEQSGNVKEIVSQANYLIKNGGGEMKIALNPEGMGQVKLKVAVQDGQVNVEMVTESHEAKKLLEKGLGDLKATLASHKLNVDNIKVDFSGQIAKQFDHAHDEAQRQSAQQFMEQFSQQNSAWRRNFFDIPGARMTGQPTEKTGPQDELMAIKANSKKSSSRRLDLVA
ncbi:MAG: flagellar hook-length control protein FliK [Bdellovibrionales bacterium]|nr:flagellar hook-length control protein FliK [Bdellovibrionales bacterium]